LTKQSVPDTSSSEQRSRHESGTSLAAILGGVRDLRSQGTGFALCLVAYTEGSSYRKPGAVALVSAEHRIGVISGGCLEPDLETDARGALASGEARYVVFDSLDDNDMLFGSGSGCQGRTHVLILPDQPPYSALGTALLTADERHLCLEAALFIDGTGLGRGACWVGTSEVLIGWGLDVAALRAAPTGESRIPHNGQRCRVSRISIAPVPRLLIIGAGPEAAPLLQLTRGLGWRSLVVDHRSAALEALSPLCDRTVAARPAEALARFSDSTIDACVVMTHSAANDLEALRALACFPVPYIGLLGPPSRRNGLLRLLGKDCRAAILSRLHAPAGIKLGGHGPEVVALSVAAELQQQFSGLLRPSRIQDSVSVWTAPGERSMADRRNPSNRDQTVCALEQSDTGTPLQSVLSESTDKGRSCHRHAHCTRAPG
jgi:xanthine dehydrogenase accessory factor